ncbi:hypothetical protein [Ferroacidibacillus organovorans]|uniref:hypothetical protein n=1 Tax=Ferroacidibacillus organovorans TaxID=1765683 RepID=UPI001E6108C3|nr:hypothetical protein [Ferroacidibacillus organovorans]
MSGSITFLLSQSYDLLDSPAKTHFPARRMGTRRPSIVSPSTFKIDMRHAMILSTLHKLFWIHMLAIYDSCGIRISNRKMTGGILIIKQILKKDTLLCDRRRDGNQGNLAKEDGHEQ